MDAAALRLMFGDNAAHRVCNLGTTAVANREVDVQARVVLAALLGSHQALEQGCGKTFIIADVLDLPVAKSGEAFGEVADDVEKFGQFFSVTARQVVCREEVESDHLNADVIAPDQKLGNLLRSGAMPVRRTLEKTLTRPAPVAIDNHANVVRQDVGGEPMPQSFLVQAIQKAGATNVGIHASYVSGLCRCRGCQRMTKKSRILASMTAHDIATDEVKPVWRGWIHTGVFPIALAAGIVLLVLANGSAAKASSAIFVLTSLLLFGNSALYHRFHWKPRTKIILKRIDHANIFLLIAGTYTPLAVLALPRDQGTLLLILVWSGTLLGIAFRVFWISAPRWLYVPLYVLMGWGAFVYIVPLFTASAPMMILVLAGGLLYTVGAVIYGMKKPNPIPGVFGFHEIFHSLTVLAFLCHWSAVLIIALAPVYNS